MKTGKKIRLLGFTAAACIILSSCGSTLNADPSASEEVPPAEKITLTLFTDLPALFQEAAEGYPLRNEQVTIEVKEAGDQPAEELRQRLLTGAPTDIVYLTYDHNDGVYEALAEDNVLYDLAEAFNGVEFYEGFLDGFPARGHGDGQLTGAPLAYDCAGLIAKTKYFTNATPPETFDGILELGAADTSRKLFGFPQDYPAMLEPLTLPLIATAEDPVRFRTSDYASGGFSSAKTLEIAQKLEELSKYTYNSDTATDLNSLYNAFQQDQVMMIPGDAGSYSLLRSQYDVTDEMLLRPVPSPNGKQYLLTRLALAYVPAASLHPDEAAKFLAALYDERYFPGMVESSGFLPPVKGSASNMSGFRRAAADLFEHGVVAYCGSFAEDTESGDLFSGTYSALSDLLTGKLNAADWAAKMDSLISNPGGGGETASDGEESESTSSESDAAKIAAEAQKAAQEALEAALVPPSYQQPVYSAPAYTPPVSQAPRSSSAPEPEPESSEEEESSSSRSSKKSQTVSGGMEEKDVNEPSSSKWYGESEEDDEESWITANDKKDKFSNDLDEAIFNDRKDKFEEREAERDDEE